MKTKHPNIPIPNSMKSLPLSEKGYLKPWFVKDNDFRVVDEEKAKISVSKQKCWICGKPFEAPRYALVGSPLSAMFREFREPPCHLECAEYAMQVCPFLLIPSAKRRTAGLLESETIENSNKYLDVKYDPENSGENYIVLVNDFKFDNKTLMMKCSEENIIERQYWVGGAKQAEHPIPIVPINELPDYIKNQLKNNRSIKSPMKLTLENSIFYSRKIPICAKDHTNMLWRKPSDFEFLSAEALIPVGFDEIPIAVHSLPLAFVPAEQGYSIFAVTGLENGSNLLVNTKGQWIGRFIPQACKVFPFVCHDSTLDSIEPSEQVYRVDYDEFVFPTDATIENEKDLLSAHPFYIDEENHSQQFADTVIDVHKMTQNRYKLRLICKFLDENNLLMPWPIILQDQNGTTERSLKGLFRIDEIALNSLDSSKLAALREMGGLWIAYCQLLSMKHLVDLGRLANMKGDK